MIIIFVGGGDVIVWGKLLPFTGWLTSPYRRVTFPHNLHHVDVYINRKVMTLPPQIINDDIENGSGYVPEKDYPTVSYRLLSTV